MSGRLAGAGVVARAELRKLWLGGWAFGLIILYSAALGVFTFLLATNYELSLIPANDMVMLMIKMASAFALFTCLIAGADTISGERDRGTLESMLLTPISRQGFVLGKFLAAFSFWPVIFLVTIPYLMILAPSLGMLIGAIVAMAVMVSLLAIVTSGFGVLVSLRATSNYGSIAIALLSFVIVLLPTQLPGSMQTGAVGKVIKHLSPMESTIHLVEKILVNNRGIEEVATYLLSPILGLMAVLGYLFWIEAPRLNLMGGRNTFELPNRVTGTPAVNLVVLVLLCGPTVFGSKATSAEPRFEITLDQVLLEAKTGDTLSFTTRVTNSSDTSSGSLLLAMNLVDYANGTPIDPEDWTPALTRKIEPLGAGASTELVWNLHAILDGDYLAYVAVLPMNAATGTAPEPQLSPSARLHIQPFTRLNPQGVIPVILGVPLFLSALMIGLKRRQRRLRVPV